MFFLGGVKGKRGNFPHFGGANLRHPQSPETRECRNLEFNHLKRGTRPGTRPGNLVVPSAFRPLNLRSQTDPGLHQLCQGAAGEGLPAAPGMIVYWTLLFGTCIPEDQQTSLGVPRFSHPLGLPYAPNTWDSAPRSGLWMAFLERWSQPKLQGGTLAMPCVFARGVTAASLRSSSKLAFSGVPAALRFDERNF